MPLILSKFFAFFKRKIVCLNHLGVTFSYNRLDNSVFRVDLNGFLIEGDVGKILKNWNREPTIVEFILHNVPKLTNESCIQDFLSVTQLL